MTSSTDRRDFLKMASLAGGSLLLSGCHTMRARRSTTDKLRVAVIGCGGRGNGDARGFESEEIVALCDVDQKRAAGRFRRHPDARKYTDFRALLEREKDIDTVVVATPDHTHALASAMALDLGHNVYCEKPLTHNIREARRLRELARGSDAVTAMGNQGSAMTGLRRVVELVQSDAIGPVRRVHCWTDRPSRWWPQPSAVPADSMVVPDHLNWDLWLGPATWRRYHNAYAPFAWRGWWDFGTGALGDMGCHVANAAFMALKLGSPTSVVAKTSHPGAESPPASSVIRYQFPERGGMPPVEFVWYDGGEKPSARLAPGVKFGGNGSLLIGDEGMIYLDEAYGRNPKLLPEEKFADFVDPEPWLPRVKGIHAEFIAACKGGPPPLSQFEYATALTETILLGNVAVRAGERIEWDSEAMTIPNAPSAEAYLTREVRRGWEL